MAGKNRGFDKLEKLQKRMDDIDKVIKSNIEIKQQINKEIEGIIADTLLQASRESGLTIKEATMSFKLYADYKKSGMGFDEIISLINENAKTESEEKVTDPTLSPLDTKNPNETGGQK